MTLNIFFQSLYVAPSSPEAPKLHCSDGSYCWDRKWELTEGKLHTPNPWAMYTE